jgi:hypothetical protein
MPPFVADGDPITGTDKTWTWIPFPDTQCRDGSPAGVSVNLNSGSNKVMIFLEGGGACFSADTCGSNPANVPTTAQKPANVTGVFDRANTQNPVGDWNFVYVGR